jgi:hypothetical protein
MIEVVKASFRDINVLFIPKKILARFGSEKSFHLR